MTAPARLFDPRQHGWAAARVGLLMLVSALTEGLGIVLLVPLLALLGQGADGRLAQLLSSVGVPFALGPMLALFIALMLLRVLINHARQLASMRLELALVNRLRMRAWQAMLLCDWRVAMGLSRGAATNALAGQVNQAGYVVNQGLAALAALVTLAGVGAAALAISWQLALTGLVGGVLVIVAYRGMRRRAARLGEQMSLAYARVFTRLDEGLQALRMIKSLGSEARSIADLAGEFVGLEQAQIRFQRDLSLSRALLQLGGAALLALLVWVAVTRWHMATASLLPMIALFARAVPLLEALQQSLLAVANGRPAIDAALTLIATAEAAREPEAAGVAAPPLTRELALHGVSLAFPGQGEPALAGIDLVLPAGSITALIGPSGAGKSTVADLLGGLLSPDCGSVTVDDAVLDPVLRRAWRGRVAYVQQDPVLLSASLRDNLLWAEPVASAERIEAALRDAAADFAFALPQGLDTPLGDGGRRLSGGERQRLMLARALLRDPALLILDEATSALDPANEGLIAQAIARLKGRITILVIGHHGQLSALADRQVRLDRGRIVAG